MSIILDPVWPWSRLWEILLQVPSAIQIIAGMAAVLAAVLPIMLFPLDASATAALRGRRRRMVLTVTTALLLSL
ncbi:MAG: hypothetical protein ACHQIO_23515, partial [Nevskiales bacterium]